MKRGSCVGDGLWPESSCVVSGVVRFGRRLGFVSKCSRLAHCVAEQEAHGEGQQQCGGDRQASRVLLYSLDSVVPGKKSLQKAPCKVVSQAITRPILERISKLSACYQQNLQTRARTHGRAR